jgi:hypothetical protein
VKITPTHRRFTLLVLVAGAAYCGGGLTVSALVEPEVVTVSEDVPSACADAARTAAVGFKAWENLAQYETKAQVLASELTGSLLSGDASKIEDELHPIAEHNVKEAEWRGKRDSALSTFEAAADECLAKAAAAEAARGR